MKKIKSAVRIVPKIQAVKMRALKISEKTIATTQKTNNFLLDIADIFLFTARIVKETFSRHFEFKEFLHQCYNIGYKTLPLISITGTIMGLVLTIQSRPVLVDFGAVTMLPGMVAVSLIRGNGTRDYRVDLCRKNCFGNGCGVGIHESNRTN